MCPVMASARKRNQNEIETALFYLLDLCFFLRQLILTPIFVLLFCINALKRCGGVVLSALVAFLLLSTRFGPRPLARTSNVCFSSGSPGSTRSGSKQ